MRWFLRLGRFVARVGACFFVGKDVCTKRDNYRWIPNICRAYSDVGGVLDVSAEEGLKKCEGV